MQKKSSDYYVKMVVITAIGAALYGFGGLIGIPVFANTTIKPAMAVLALFAAVWGPVVGLAVGFLGHLITDLLAGWGVWMSWVVGSAICGAGLGLYRMATANSVEKGVFGGKQLGLLALISILSNVVGYGVSVILDLIIYAEPFLKAFTQMLISSVSNTAVIVVIGGVLMRLVAMRYASKTNLEEDKNV